jgi:hypothetical protein
MAPCRSQCISWWKAIAPSTSSLFTGAGLHQSPCRTETAPTFSRLLEKFMMSQDVDGHLPKPPMDYTTQIFDCLCSGIRQQHDQKRKSWWNWPIHLCVWVIGQCHIICTLFVMAVQNLSKDRYFVRTKLSAIIRNDLVLTASCFFSVDYTLRLLSSVFGPLIGFINRV